VLAERRTTNGVTRSTSYSYNLDGSVAALVYPSGRTITYAYDSAARPLSSVDSANNYALAASYAPQGALTSLVLGQSASFGGMNLNQAFNSRLQPSTVRAWSTNGTVLDLTYWFNSNMSDADRAAHNCTASAVQNNGNVAQVANNRTAARTQNFKYDELNRIQKGYTETTTGQYCWGETFSYDVWANLLSIGAIAPQYTGCAQENLSVAATVKNQISGDTYDAAGNLTATPAPVAASYTYNAENELTNANGMGYVYDGDGKRVQKSSGKLYWYGMGSDPLAESDAAGNFTDEYIFFGGKRIARRHVNPTPPDTITYYFVDHLGTSRVVTDATGTTLDDSDFYPFGGERPAITPSSGNTYKFTGKERDAESGLDNFGARYNSSAMGRFMSPDPFGGHQEDPQTLNEYSYVGNNPLNLTDPTGLDFHLSCTETANNSDTCQGGHVGQYVTDNKGNKTFQDTVVTSASLQDPKSGNTGTVNENGVQITMAQGTFQGIFINNTPAADLQGSGELADFSFHISYSNVKVGTLAGGAFSFNGTASQARALLQARGAFNYGFRDDLGGSILGFHPGTDQFRFGTGPSPHLSVPSDWVPRAAGGMEGQLTFLFVQNPKLTVPLTGDFHVDARTGSGHARDVICGLTGLGCN
jgi:RHS repeat-associated protein